jgi:hypothetical protein
MVVFDTLTSLFASNPVFAGGVGTLLVGSALYVLRAIPEKLLDAAERTMWTKVFVESLSSEYRDVDSFIEGRRAKFFSRSLEMKDGSLKTGFGSGWGTYEGTLFRYAKTKSTSRSRRSRRLRCLSSRATAAWWNASWRTAGRKSTAIRSMFPCLARTAAAGGCAAASVGLRLSSSTKTSSGGWLIA